MYSFKDKRILPYTAELINDIVLDIENYPEFLPWCRKARIISSTENEIIAELTITFKIFEESYKSRITTTKTTEDFTINVEAISGPFKKLQNFWQIKKMNDQCEVDFSIDFEFNSSLLAAIMRGFFSIAINKMISAFEARAAYLSALNDNK